MTRLLEPRSSLRGTAVLLAFAALTLLAACGDDDGEDDPRRAQIGATAELATYAYAASGADGLYDYLAPAVTDKCTPDQVTDDLEGEATPTDFRGLDAVSFEAEQAKATVSLIYGDDDRDVEWTFVQTNGESWRLIAVPGLEECAG